MSEQSVEKDVLVRVDQTILASDPKRQGNCLSACVATYLGRPLDEVPHFAEYASDRKDAWWDCLIGYMAGHGLWAYDIGLSDAEPGEVVFVMGMSPRGVCHQVLYRDGALWHDPHPSRGGILDVREVIRWRPVRHDHAPTDTRVIPPEVGAP
jgi:hypothetical protein